MGELAAADAALESKVVADHGARTCLSTDRLPFDDDGLQSFRSGVDGGRQAGRTCTDHRDIVDAAGSPDLNAVRCGQLGIGRIMQDGAVVTDGCRKTGRIDAELPNEILPLSGIRRAELE